MRIVHVEIQNFRGIKQLAWSPAPGMNCLIGPGDSCKTTILDAIELVLNPKSYVFADDSDFFGVDFATPIIITVTMADLPTEFKAEDRYGMYLRGWNLQESTVEDEPGDVLDDALSVRVVIDKSLEARWAIFNNRISEDADPPMIRYKDMKKFGTTRLGPFAEKHLGWGRQSVLTRVGEDAGGLNLQLAEAGRAAREAFREGNQEVFQETISLAETLGKKFSVPIREKYRAELDVQSVNITAGGVALHDGKLPLRRLGTGSSRLLVSALQHDAGCSHIALIDEVEHGLEPHRIARLLKYLKSPTVSEGKTPASQIFMTTHSPVVIQELTAADISAVRTEKGMVSVCSIKMTGWDDDSVQRHLRTSPEAFLARKVLVGEGKTELGLLRGLDTWWSTNGWDSFAWQGAVSVNGGGNSSAPMLAEHLLDLGYKVALILDSDKPADAATLARVKNKGGEVFEWPDTCSTEERIFLDVPWETVKILVEYAVELKGMDSVRDCINHHVRAKGLNTIEDLTLPDSLENPEFRRVIGITAKQKSQEWFKDIDKGERWPRSSDLAST